jgi:hypothetical protein
MSQELGPWSFRPVTVALILIGVIVAWGFLMAVVTI